MKSYSHNCDSDYEQEQGAEAERQTHEDGECRGVPVCGYCQDERDESEEREKAEGYYDLNNHWRPRR